MPLTLRSLLPPPLDALLTRDSRRAAVLIVTPAGLVLALGLSGGGHLAAVAAALIAGALGAAVASLERASERSSRPEPAPFGTLLEPVIPALEALESLPDPLMVVEAGDADDFTARRLIFANAAAQELLRIPREGALLVSALRRPEILEAVDESLFGRVDAAVAFETGGAQDRFWRVWSRPLGGEGRRLALLLMRDETDARRNERMRADFMANASHELRTPLASLAGFVETLRGHAKDDADARGRFLDIMAVQADRMRRLIEDLLSLSRIELNEHIPPSGECDMALAAADVADAVSLLVGHRGVRLDLDLPPRGEAVVVGDRDQILQVLQNLLDNAVKYSPPGGTVRMEVAGGLSLDRVLGGDPAGPRDTAGGWGRLPLLTPDRRDDDDRFVRVTVTDPGPGIDREHLPRLAERFYRVEGQKSGERAGTGLGLAIVKHIVNRHRGGLVVESAPGRGSAFTAYFPMSTTAVEAADPAPHSLAAVTKLS
ncbi:MAG TPA: ATP-binding protein [Caulobacteraceae bacterium]|jgi:two-component system phosphate regulon sensor histidine kinase PhoR|nr:ATP-binding protein [Caulobacteraceae bacterium]